MSFTKRSVSAQARAEEEVAGGEQAGPEGRGGRRGSGHRDAEERGFPILCEERGDTKLHK